MHLRPINLTPKDIKEFQQIYPRVYNEHISTEEAEREARRFLRFMNIVMN